MKICLLTYRGNMYCGGQGVYICYLAGALQEMGHEVHVVSGPPYPTPPEGVKLHKVLGLNLYETSNLSSLSNPLRAFTPLNLYEIAAVHIGFFPDIFTFSMRAYFKLRELMSVERFDVIHDNQTLGYGLLLMKGLGVPVVATIHHPITVDLAASLAQADTFRRGIRWTMFYSFLTMQGIVSRRMARVITVSRSSAEDTARAFKLRKDRVRVVYNGIDTDVYSMNEEVSPARDGLIMVANTDDRKKGVLYLLQALQLLREDGIKLTIVDDAERHSSYIEDVGPLPSYGSELVRKLNLDGMVHFTGRLTREELARRYAAARIAVVPSLYEGFGLPAAEAMACGTPVIATTGGALPEVVGDAGILVPPRSANALAAAIRQLINDKQAQRQMSEAGKKRVREQFNWEQAARKTLEVYQEVMTTK